MLNLDSLSFGIEKKYFSGTRVCPEPPRRDLRSGGQQSKPVGSFSELDADSAKAAAGKPGLVIPSISER